MFRSITTRLGALLWCGALLLAGAASPAVAQSAGDAGLEVTWIGNAGFLVSSGKHRVLVDALYGDDIGGYVATPAEAREKIARAEPPYDAVDLLLVTHHHPDHFDPASVARHLRNNPEALLITTPQAVELLEKSVEDFAPLASRVRAELPEEGAQTRIEHRGIDVTVMNLHHGRELDPPVENLGFVVSFDGKSFLHVGDTEASYGEMYVQKLDRRHIDVQFLGFWELLRPARWRIFYQLADRTVATHIPRKDAGPSYFAGAGSLEGVMQKLQAIDPPVIVFSHPMETKTIAPLPADDEEEKKP